MIEQMDGAIGRVFRTLRESGLEKNTLVIFTSDNGGQLDDGARNGPHRGGKQDLYQDGLLVPFVARWPGIILPGATSNSVAVTLDIPPTLLRIAGTRPIGDGIDLRPALSGKALPDRERELVWVRREGGGRYRGLQYEAVRRGPWKLIRNTPFTPFELFNLESDPRESKDLAATRPEQAGRLLSLLQRHMQRAGSVPWQPPPGAPAAAGGEQSR